MQEALDDLISLLDLEPIEVNLFRGLSPDEDRQRVFGGQVAGQALVAAARTIEEPGRLVHSLHASSARETRKCPSCTRLTESATAKASQLVVSWQFNMVEQFLIFQASFHDQEPGHDHQNAAPLDVPAPETLPNFQERMAPYKDKIGPMYDTPLPLMCAM